MALYLSEQDVSALVTMPMALAAVESAHRAHVLGRAQDIPRNRIRFPGVTMHLLQGGVQAEGVLGYKVYTSSREGNRFLVHLYDAATGRPLAVLGADALGMMRTGAAGGVAAKWLARPDARIAGVFGAGWQAQSQIEALCAVRDIEEIKVFSRRQEPLQAFCRRMSERLGRTVRPATGPEEVVRGSDVVVTVTTSAQPVFEGAWLEPGTHINAAGSNSLIRRELDEACLRRCLPIVVDSRATALKEAGDLLPLLEKGRSHEGQWVELGEVIAGLRPGRTSPEQISVFESQGMAIQDLALAARVLAKARELRLGLELPY